MNGKTYIPSLDGYDSGEAPTLSVWDEWDSEERDDDPYDDEASSLGGT